MLTGIIMASGLSRRMGQNKLLMDYKGHHIFEYVLQAVRQSKVDDMVVITSHKAIEEFCAKHGIASRWNDAPEEGQGNSIKLGVAHCAPQSDYMFFVADQPLLDVKTIDEIICYYFHYQGQIIVPTNQKKPCNPKIFPNALREELLQLPADARGSDLVKKHRDLVKMVEVESPMAFMDVDTEEDYKNLLHKDR